jgi:glycosyltransferase involved in cell wall biosynthesis
MVLVVIPAYNEEKELGRVIRGLFEHGFKDVVVVDDGSTDRTATVARESGGKVLSHLLNRGQGAAIETGDSCARALQPDFVVHFDADGQFNPVDIIPALRLMQEKNLDVVLGSRFLDNRSKLPWLKKYLVLPVARWINFVFTGVALTDVHNGFRILSKKALEKIVLSQDRMAHNTEIIQQIKKHQLAFAECPVEVSYHEYGQGISGGYKIVHDLFVGLFSKTS